MADGLYDSMKYPCKCHETAIRGEISCPAHNRIDELEEEKVKGNLDFQAKVTELNNALAKDLDEGSQYHTSIAKESFKLNYPYLVDALEEFE